MNRIKSKGQTRKNISVELSLDRKAKSIQLLRRRLQYWLRSKINFRQDRLPPCRRFTLGYNVMKGN